MATKTKSPTRVTLRHYWEQMKLEWLASIITFTLPGLAKICIIYIPPLIIAKIINDFSKHGFTSGTQLIPYLLAVVLAWSVGQVLIRIGVQAGIRMQTQGIKNLYNNGFKELMSKDISFFDNNFAGSLTKRLTSYSKGFEGFTDTLIFNVCDNAITLIFSIIILWSYSFWLVVALVGTVIVTTAVVIPLVIRRQKIVDEREKRSNIAVGNIADSIGNMAAVRTFGQEDFERKQHKRLVQNYIDQLKASWDFQNLKVDVATSPLYVLGNTLGLAVALMLSANGELNVGVIFVAFSYFASTTAVLFEFTGIYRSLEGNITEAAQFTALLENKPTISDMPNSKPFNVTKPSVELKDISFKYVDAVGEHLFNNLSLSIKPGEKIGLVGPSGGGKSTIAKLLLRIMDVSEGSIEISDRDVKTIRQQDLRQAIAYVPQDPALFHRSLAENIAYGKMDASQEEIKAAAKLAYADEFIDKLSEGYQTLVGERGVKLSGGQRQRISIARAILKDAPILVLDEATSALDSESEKLIQDALTNLMKGRTTIVIAHRLSTIQKMDRIVVLEEGVITEQGTHAELLKKDGLYAKLWGHQSGGFIED